MSTASAILCNICIRTDDPIVLYQFYADLLPELEEVIDDAAVAAKLYGLLPGEN